jgi:hypothetical protein
VYNPYYTLILQRLCDTAHSYKVTLQYCLWDFLRDLGERSVGGAEVVKNLRDDEDDSLGSGKKITERKMRNLARAYAWCVAKGYLTLVILKVSWHNFAGRQESTNESGSRSTLQCLSRSPGRFYASSLLNYS